METAIFRLPVEKLDARLLKSLKLLFEGQEIEITVRASAKSKPRKTLDELLESREQAGVTYDVPGEAFADILDHAETDEDFDVVAAIRQFKVERQ